MCVKEIGQKLFVATALLLEDNTSVKKDNPRNSKPMQKLSNKLLKSVHQHMTTLADFTGKLSTIKCKHTCSYLSVVGA